MRNEKQSTNNFNKLIKATSGAILVGPEGGFTMKEKSYLKQKKFIIPINFGQRILKSDTAVITGLVFWQTLNGDMKTIFK
jgi:16S rRNA (uracil1498-N3)-methyltransferase